jgi:heterodisulfide reductase subunit B
MESYLYFPGCTLRSVAKDFDRSAKVCAKALGFELKEMEGWLCCGAVLSNSDENLMARAGPNRILARAHAEGDTLVTLCAGCYNVLKRTDLRATRGLEEQRKINTFNEDAFTGGVSVIHFLEVLRDRVGFDAIGEAVKKPLHGLPVGAYYGCLLLRPFSEMKFDDPHRPSILERLLASIGATPIDYPLRTECCGSYLGVGSPGNVERMSRKIIESAHDCGAKIIAVSCPLCKYNLEVSQNSSSDGSVADGSLPIVYFTQLLGLALEIPPEQLDLNEWQIGAIRESLEASIGSVTQI